MDGIYVETDFLLALVKDEDWLHSRAVTVFDTYEDALWTSRDTLIELMMVAYPEGWNVVTVVAAAKAIVRVDGDAESILAAASHVEESGYTPFDALHLVHSGSSPIASGDSSYDGFSDRIPLKDDSNSLEQGLITLN